METFKQRLQRFENNSPIEFIETILLNIQNYFFPQLNIASKERLDDLLILGIHSVIETISENVFLKKGKDGFKFYLENFVDANKNGFKFSEIADVLNDLRNIIAHQKVSRLGHSFGFNDGIQIGYKIDGTIVILNPKIFFEQFKSAFSGEIGKTRLRIWDYHRLLNQKQMERAKEKFIKKFMER